MKIERIKFYFENGFGVVRFSNYFPIYFTIGKKSKTFFFKDGNDVHVDITPILCQKKKQFLINAIQQELNK